MAEYRRTEDMTLSDAKARAALIARAPLAHGARTYTEHAAVLLLDEVERLEARLRAAEERAARLEAACVVVCGDGERQCLLCGEWADPPKPIAHDEECPLVGNTAALDAAKAEAVREALAKVRARVYTLEGAMTHDGTVMQCGTDSPLVDRHDVLAALDADGGSDG